MMSYTSAGMARIVVMGLAVLMGILRGEEGQTRRRHSGPRTRRWSGLTASRDTRVAAA